MTIRTLRLLLAASLVSTVPLRGVHYVGTQVCAGCHQEIAASYSKTAMGRSMVRGDDVSLGARLPVPFTLFDRDAGEYFEVSQKAGAYYQSQYAVNRDGKELFRQTWKIAFLVGSGENGFSFLVQRNGYLFEAPLSYFTKTRTWSFSPGYERRNLAFTRRVIPECVSCHAGRPQPVYEKPGLYRDPPFAELAVGCESCHGPGEAHVADRRAGRPLAGKVDASIVNPAHLSGWLSDNICMKCHQGGDVRVELPGKHVDDFQPGAPLNQVLAIFKAPLKPDSVLLEHYFSTTLSKCYRVSAGKLSCITCHDPHQQPVPAYYRARCLTCHQEASCKVAVADRRKRNPLDDCAGCHMPKRTVTTITHAALTDHRIAARPDEPYPGTASDLLLLTAAPGDAKLNVPPITLFQAYSSLSKDGHAEFGSKAAELLDQLARDSPQEPRVLSALARRSLATDTQAAIRYLTAALKAGSTAPEDALLLADLYSRGEQSGDAIAVLRRGMLDNPYTREFPEALAAILIRQGDYRTAQETIRKALEVFPDDLALRMLGKKVEDAILP